MVAAAARGPRQPDGGRAGGVGMGELLSLRGVGLGFRRGRGRLRVLADASLEVRAGEIVAVVGSRGEGKTTLLEVAAGILPPDEGRVRFGGVELTRAWRRGPCGAVGPGHQMGAARGHRPCV